MGTRRAIHLRRTWLFVPGGDREALRDAGASGADVLIQELEDFVPERHKQAARDLSGPVLADWRRAGIVAAVRINPLFEPHGRADLAQALEAGADAILLPKVRHAGDVVDLDRETSRLEIALGLPQGLVELVPNIESAQALMQCHAIATASPRVSACLLASEDMAADLGSERVPGGTELDYVRQRFLLECTAAGVLAIDCPYTWSDVEGAVRETRWARRLGYRAKSLVSAAHAEPLNRELTPQADTVDEARRIVVAFERAQALGTGRAVLGDNLVEMPTYLNARRLLARAEALSAAEPRKGQSA